MRTVASALSVRRDTAGVASVRLMTFRSIRCMTVLFLLSYGYGISTLSRSCLWRSKALPAGTTSKNPNRCSCSCCGTVLGLCAVLRSACCRAAACSCKEQVSTYENLEDGPAEFSGHLLQLMALMARLADSYISKTCTRCLQLYYSSAALCTCVSCVGVLDDGACYLGFGSH